jgi:hypothetical protein
MERCTFIELGIFLRRDEGKETEEKKRKEY